MIRRWKFWVGVAVVVMVAILTMPVWGYRALALCGFLSSWFLREGTTIGGRAMRRRRLA